MKRHPIQLRWRVLEALILLLIISAGSFFVFVFSQRLEQRMERLKEQVVVMLEQQLGRRISYESISPSVFGYLAVRDFTVYSFDDPDQILLSINRLKIYYNIVVFLATQDPLRSLTEIQIAGSRFSVDYERDRELIEILRSVMENGSATGLTQGLPISITGTNLTIDYRHGDQQIRVSELFFNLSSLEARYHVSVRASVEMVYLGSAGRRPSFIPSRPGPGGGHSDRGRESRRLQSRLKISGSVDQQLRWSDLGIKIYSLSTDGFALKRQTLQLISDESGLEVRKIQDRAPIDIQFLFEVASGDMSFRFVAEGFRPSSLVELTGELERYDGLLDSLVTASGSLTYNIKRGSLRYQSDLRLVLPSKLLPFDATVTSRVRGDERIVYLDPLLLDTSDGTMQFSGNVLLSNLFPSGILMVNGFEPEAGRSIGTSVVLQRGDNTLKVDARELRIGEVDFRDLEINLTPEDGAVGFELGTSLGDGKLRAGGRFRLAPGPELSVSADLDRVPPSTISRLIAPESEIADLAASKLAPYVLSMSTEAWTDFRSFRLSSPQLQLVDREDPDNRLSLSVTASDQFVEIEDLELHWGDYSLTGLVSAETSPERTTARSLLWVQGIPYQIEASYSPGQGISLQGSYGLDVAVLPYGLGDPSLSPNPFAPLTGNPFRIRAAALPLPLPAGTIKVSLDVIGVLTSDGGVVARSDFFEVQDIPIRTVGSNALQLAFELRERKLEIRRIGYRDTVSSLSGSGSVALQDLSPLSVSAQLSLADSNGEERYSLTAEIEDKALQGELLFDRAPLERLGDIVISGDAEGAIRAAGTLEDPEIEVRVALQDGRLNVDRMEARLYARASRKRFVLESLDLELLSHRLTGASGSLDFETGALRLASPYRGDFFGKDVRFSLAIEGDLENPSRLLEGEQILNLGFEGTLRMGNVRLDNGVRPDWLLGLRARDGVLSVDGGPREGIDAQLDAEGRFTAVLQDPLPIQGTVRGQLERGRIDSFFEVSFFDMRVIPAMTRVDDIWNFAQGSGQGTVRIVGPVNDPDWNGRMEVKDLLVSVDLSPEVLGPVEGTVFFDEKSFYFPRVKARGGKTTVEAEGVFYIDHWEPVALELMLFFQEEPGGHVRYTFGPIFVDGYGTGAVRIASDESMTRVEGKVRALNCRVAIQREDASEEAAPPPVPPVPLLVDMKIKTGRGVEFFWPAVNFPVVHSYVKQGEDIHVYLDESTGELTIKGQAEIRGGEVFYFDRSFYLKEGSITFEESIGDIDPWIRALAEIRERDVENEEIRIYLEANNKLSQFSPRFYSEPSRPDVEILNMIGGTILNRFEQTDFGTAAVMLTSDIVGQFGILSPFERAVREVLRLDLFSIRTQFLQNVLFGKILGTDSQLSTTNPLDNTTLSLGKYLGTDLFLEALIRFQAVNEIDAVNNIRTEGELSLEWTTPFFLLEWTFTPLHPENLFLTDNSIGLSWKFSY